MSHTYPHTCSVVVSLMRVMAAENKINTHRLDVVETNI